MRKFVPVLVGLLLVAALFPGIAAADQTRAGGTVVVEEGETVTGGLTATSGSVMIYGTVDGDLTAFAGDVVVTGTVTGDVSAAAGSVRIAGTVGGDVSAAAGSVHVGPDAEIGGDLSAGAGSVLVEGTVRGNVAMGGESLHITDTAVIDGNVEYDGDLTRADDATIGGTVTRNDDLSVESPAWGGPVTGVGAWVIDVWGLLTGLLIGAILLVVAPSFSEDMVARVTDTPLQSGLAGVATLVAVPILIIVLAITLVGIPLAILVALLFVPLVFVAIIYGAYAVGSWLLSLADVVNKWAALALGLLVMTLLDFLPWVGGFVQLVVFLLGLGAITLALYAWFQNRRESSRSKPAEPTA